MVIKFTAILILLLQLLTHGLEHPADGAVAAAADDFEVGQVLKERKSCQKNKEFAFNANL